MRREVEATVALVLVVLLCSACQDYRGFGDRDDGSVSVDCVGITCSHHGDCQIEGDAAFCLCDQGYLAVGLQCLEDYCYQIDCSGHGHCTVSDNTPFCICDEGYIVGDSLECIEEQVECRTDADCDDANECTEDKCILSRCKTSLIADGISCDDGDYCTVGDRCQSGECLPGEDGPDVDGDGHIDSSCPGGDDCDDSDANINPDFHEGEEESPFCVDGSDNDCDGDIDSQEASCSHIEGACDDGGWCWINPVPVGIDFFTVYSYSDGSAVAGAISGTVVYLNQDNPRVEYLDASRPIISIWAFGKDDIWASSGDSVLHYGEDSGWVKEDVEVQATCPEESKMETKSVWGLNPNDVWMVGYGNYCSGYYPNCQCLRKTTAIRNYNGERQKYKLEHGIWFTDVFGVSSDDIWLSLLALPYCHYHGVDLECDEDGYTNYIEEELWGISSDSMWTTALGGVAHFDGQSWEGILLEGEPSPSGIWGSSDSDIWIVGQEGRFDHYDGYGWTRVDSPSSAWYRSIHGTSSNDYWAVGTSGEAARYDGESWDRLSRHLAGSPVDVFGFGPERVLFLWEDGSIKELDGVDLVQGGNELDTPALSFWGESEQDIWIVYNDDVTGIDYIRFDGSGFSENYRSAIDVFGSIIGRAENDIWVVGGRNGQCATEHWNGNEWKAIDCGDGASLSGVWVASGSSVWAVGKQGTVLHWTGRERWVQVQLGIESDLDALWGSSDNDIWIASADLKMLHFNGVEIDSTTISKSVRVTSMCGFASDDIYAGGNPYDGVDTGPWELLHWNGEEWVYLDIRVQGAFRDIWGPDRDHLWAIGDRGSVLSWSSDRVRR